MELVTFKCTYFSLDLFQLLIQQFYLFGLALVAVFEFAYPHLVLLDIEFELVLLSFELVLVFIQKL